MREEIKKWISYILAPKVLKSSYDELEHDFNIYRILSAENEVILDSENHVLLNDISSCENELKTIQENTLKDYFYKKHPRQRSHTFNGMRIKNFCTDNNDQTPLITGKSHDDIANKCLIWVKNNIIYTPDIKEHWQTANETIERGRGDCEDGAILLYNMMVKNGVPEWRIRLNCGSVQHPSNSKSTIGHAYLTYLRTLNNVWYVMDWCYWATESYTYRKRWRDAEKYFTCWFSWNKDYVWLDLKKE